MRLKTLRAAVVAMAGLAASACSTADLEMFNAGLEMYNGVQYYDQTAPDQRFDCGSGEGYVTRHRGVRSNQQYVYFTSHTPNQATIRVNVSGGLLDPRGLPDLRHPLDLSQLFAGL